MKAKDYANQFNANPTINQVIEIGIAFDKETAALIKARSVKSDEAFKAVLNEMDLKWQAFAKHCNGFVCPKGYRKIMRNLHPTTAAFAWPHDIQYL